MKNSIAIAVFVATCSGVAYGQGLADIVKKVEADRSAAPVTKVYTNGDLHHESGDHGAEAATAQSLVERSAVIVSHTEPAKPPAKRTTVASQAKTEGSHVYRDSFTEDHVQKGSAADLLNRAAETTREGQRLDANSAAIAWAVRPICINGECYPKKP
jgi:hypothetical protein